MVAAVGVAQPERGDVGPRFGRDGRRIHLGARTGVEPLVGAMGEVERLVGTEPPGPAAVLVDAGARRPRPGEHVGRTLGVGIVPHDD